MINKVLINPKRLKKITNIKLLHSLSETDKSSKSCTILPKVGTFKIINGWCVNYKSVPNTNFSMSLDNKETSLDLILSILLLPSGFSTIICMFPAIC